MAEYSTSEPARQSAAEGALRTCRFCRTAFSLAFPRLDCQCRKNDDGNGSQDHMPPAEYGNSDPFGYDFGTPATDSSDAKPGKPAAPDDPFSWWL